VNYLITAGPTREPIDAVRFISNRSSGKLGLALAEAAVAAGHDVTLLLGPMDEVALPTGVAVHHFETTAELQGLLADHFPHCDALIMAAAVADFRPKQVHTGKLARGEGQTLQLEPTPDLVAALASQKQRGQRIIAFALEVPDQLEARSRAKLARKGVDAIVANALEAMGSDRITMHWRTAGGEADTSVPMAKTEAARWLIEWVARLF